MSVVQYTKSFIALTLLIVAFGGCKQINGNGPIVSEIRDLKGFNTIVSNLPTSVYITEGNEYEVNFEGQQNIIDLVETKLEDNRLTLEIKNGYTFSGNIHLVVKVNSPDIKGLINHGSGNISVMNQFQTRKLSVKNSGSGKIDIVGFSTRQLSIALTGSGDINIRNGVASKASVMMTGSGHLQASNLATKNMALQLTGSGEAKIGACDTLNARIAGSGNITYRGQPELTKHLTGSGKFIHMP